MTAERWWVRAGARWIARIDAVKGHLNLAFQAMTGVSLASGALKYFGFEGFVLPFIAVTGVGTLAYAYYYTEGGVWNQVGRDRTDMSTNWSGPNMRMDDELIGSAVFAAMHGRPPDDDEQDAIAEAVDRKWRDFRNGVELGDD